MASVIKYTEEGIILPEEYQVLNEMKPQSVVFIFNENTIPPIACDLDFLYAKSRQRTKYPAESSETGLNLVNTPVEVVVDGVVQTKWEMRAGPDSILPTEYLGDSNYETGKYQMLTERDWSFLAYIKHMAFKYGLRRELYKNIHGKWIDMNSVRPHLALLTPSSSIFFAITGVATISDLSKETSIYTKLCDHRMFSEESWSGFRLRDIDEIPDIDYITKESATSNDGVYHKIPRADGTWTGVDVPVSVFEESGQTQKDNIHIEDDDYAKFTVRLGDNNTGAIGSGSTANNDHHKYDDLFLQFYKADGTTPFTDLDNMLVICNNMFVDYKRSSDQSNAIFLPNVVKYAEIQRMSTFKTPVIYRQEELSPLQPADGSRRAKILNFEIPNSEYGYSYKFEIRIYKWKGVSVSHFTEPLTYGSVLKMSGVEANKMMWLKNRMIFSRNIDKSKTILLCGNEMVPKSEWDVDRFEPNVVRLLKVEQDFDILYSEMRSKMLRYMESIGLVNDPNKPQLTDYINENGKFYDPVKTPQERLDAYITALGEYTATGTTAYPYDLHYTPSAFDIVKKQFLFRQYSIVTFDNIDETNWTVEVNENRTDIMVDKPLANHIRNRNWSPDDILVINGLVHRLENMYADVFSPPTTWYRPKNNDVFMNADIYKLQVQRRDFNSSFYMRLNKTELLAGPKEGFEYFTFNERKNVYLPVGNISNEGFLREYLPVLPNTEFNVKETYFTRNPAGEFVRVPVTETVFTEGVSYFTCKFLQDYYVLKQ